MDVYEVGAASIEITPPVGAPLAGNFRDDYASRGVHAPLQSRSVVIRRGDAAVAWISNDLLTMPASLAAEVRRQVAERCGLAGDRVMVAATHTHSGPDVSGLAAQGDPAEIQRTLAPRMAESCAQAFQACEPMHLWSAVGR